jgi:ABC-type cobalt transport system substrate-binding protein
MKKMTMISLMVLVAALGVWWFLQALDGQWSGVDETVIEHIAEQAGRPARTSLINTDQGDIILLFFLIAGAAGGFVAGYQYRRLFGERNEVGQA